ncbi:mechanosensitive ion channel family protein [Haladaptatus halobius]|uniref:mechanosensitive ion channel family protein n=1 Tax=Haladaptatus halobius TaxID=2884875 RepID=UPI001D0A1BE1|nr:mechanosensitive ion channel family protein [Haladaptatus halobius]
MSQGSMNRIYLQFQQAEPNKTANSTETATQATEAVLNPQLGPVGKVLRDLGIPFPEALGALITFAGTVVGLYMIGQLIVLPFIDRVLDRRGLDQHAQRPLKRLSKGLLLLIIIAIAFGFAGYGNLLTSLATIGAAATLAIGFALQETIKNFVSGIFIYTDRPFRIGEWIEWSSYAGIVEDIGLRVTRVRTFDNELLPVPNSVLTSDVIKNPMAKEQLRITFEFGIGYEDDIQQATDILYQEAKNHSEILDSPEPTIRMSENALADSYVGLVSRIWISNPNRAKFLRIRSEYVSRVKARFDENEIDIPYPQRELSGEFSILEDREKIEPTQSD